MIRQEGALLLFELEPEIQNQASAMLIKKGEKRKSNHNPQVRFIVSYELTLHYSNTFVPQHPLELPGIEVTIHQAIELCSALKLRLKKSALYNITTQRKWKLHPDVLPEDIKQALAKHIAAHISEAEEVKPLPVKLTIKRKTANNATPGNN